MVSPSNSGEKAPVFQFDRVSKIYPMGDSEVRALDEIDLEIREGDYSAILGPSGSGKSTLMHIMGFMDQPTSGTVLFGGDDVSGLGAGRRARYRAEFVGFVFQTFNLLPRLTVLDNTMLPLRYLRTGRRKAREKARAALDAVDLTDRAKHYPNQLSGGQRQRVAVARAIVNRPRLILADEPTGNLDTENANLILELFENLVDDGGTLVLVTHDHEIARRTRRQITIRDGKATG